MRPSPTTLQFPPPPPPPPPYPHHWHPVCLGLLKSLHLDSEFGRVLLAALCAPRKAADEARVSVVAVDSGGPRPGPGPGSLNTGALCATYALHLLPPGTVYALWVPSYCYDTALPLIATSQSAVVRLGRHWLPPPPRRPLNVQRPESELRLPASPPPLPSPPPLIPQFLKSLGRRKATLVTAAALYTSCFPTLSPAAVCACCCDFSCSIHARVNELRLLVLNHYRESRRYTNP